jgi:hypothetical protein
LQPAGIERAKRRYELRHGTQRSLNKMRSQRLRRIGGPFRRRDIARDPPAGRPDTM